MEVRRLNFFIVGKSVEKKLHKTNVREKNPIILIKFQKPSMHYVIKCQVNSVYCWCI